MGEQLSGEQLATLVVYALAGKADEEKSMLVNNILKMSDEEVVERFSISSGELKELIAKEIEKSIENSVYTEEELRKLFSSLIRNCIFDKLYLYPENYKMTFSEITPSLVDIDQKCRNCFKTNKDEGIKLQLCSSCYAAKYCCGDCQKADRQTHKGICKTIGKILEENVPKEQRRIYMKHDLVISTFFEVIRQDPEIKTALQIPIPENTIIGINLDKESLYTLKTRGVSFYSIADVLSGSRSPYAESTQSRIQSVSADEGYFLFFYTHKQTSNLFTRFIKYNKTDFTRITKLI